MENAPRKGEEVSRELLHFPSADQKPHFNIALRDINCQRPNQLWTSAAHIPNSLLCYVFIYFIVFAIFRVLII